MDLTKNFSYTIIDVARIVSYRVGNLKRGIETLDNTNSDIATIRVLQAYDDVIREIIRTKKPVWAVKETLIAPPPTVAVNASITKGGTTVTLASAVMESRYVGCDMYVYADNESCENMFFEIESMTDTTHFEIVDDFEFTTMSSKGIYMLGNRIQMPSDFMGLVGAYGFGKSLTYKTPQELSIIRQRLHPDALPHSDQGPQFCTLTRDTKSASSDQTYSYYLELYKSPQYEHWVNVLYLADYGVAVDNASAPDSRIVPVPEDAIDVLIDGMVASLQSVDLPERRDAMNRWRNTTLADYMVEGKDHFCETVTFTDEVS